MNGDRWSTYEERMKVLKVGAAGPILDFSKGKAWVYDGEGHEMILGVSGSGKSRRGTIPMTMTFINNKQSAIIVDPKGEIYSNTKNMISEDYEVHVIDFRNLYDDAAEGWNPLAAPYELWTSGTKKGKHEAEQMIEELGGAIYQVSPNADPFWVSEATNVFLALVYTLFHLAEPDEINLASLYYLIAQGDERFGAGSTYLKELVNLYPQYESIAMQLQSYVTTANDTRGGIRSTFLNGLSVATRSESIREFLSHDDLKVNHLSGDKPTLIYIVLPDETPIYNSLTGVLVSQIMNHYVRVADRQPNKALPIRLNFVLEELGNIGGAIKNLPHLLTAGRSRNIRVQYVIQSMSQLKDVYGDSDATTILSNSDVRVVYRVNNWDTLTEMSRLCGEKVIYEGGHAIKTPLITQTQLAAMETGQALVIISGRTKFITELPDFTEMYVQVPAKKPYKPVLIRKHGEFKYFDVREFVKAKKREKMEEMNAQSNPFEPAQASGAPRIPTFEEFMANREKQRQEQAAKEEKREKPTELDALVAAIDKKIAELEEEERREKAALEEQERKKNKERVNKEAADKKSGENPKSGKNGNASSAKPKSGSTKPNEEDDTDKE